MSASTPPTRPKLPPPGKTRLIERHGTPMSYIANRETDARGAITRGLAEYVEQQFAVATGGRQLAFKKVVATWAEPEQLAAYPSAAVYAEGDGTYDASKFTPAVNPKERVPDGRYVVSPADFMIDVTLDVWTEDPRAREVACDLLEDALMPVDWMFGFALELPHYFNARAVFEPRGHRYVDTEQDATRRYRRVLFTLAAVVPVIRLFSYPRARPRADVEVGLDVVVDVT